MTNVWRNFGSNALIVDSNNKPYWCENCPCTDCSGCVPSPEICANCDDCTPSGYSVVFSSVSLCSSCFDHYIGDYREVTWTSGDVLNTSHTLYQTSSCIWSKTIENAVTENRWSSDSGCFTSPDFTLQSDINISLQRVGTQWNLTVTAGDLPASIFSDTQTANVDGANSLCTTVPSFTNDNDGSLGKDCGDAVDLGPTYVGATGGSVSVTCL